MALTRVNKVVLPGDVLGSETDLEASLEGKGRIKLGPGLRHEKGDILAYKAGVLRHRQPGIYWIDCNQRRYVPTKEERVIGIVTNRVGDSFKVDIGGSVQASLPGLAFEGATKRNRPNLQIGDLVYARLCVANKDMEPELDCTDGTGHSTGLGQLSGGFVFQCSLGLTRRLLNKTSPLLKLIGKKFPFESTVGLNGRVWINAKSTNHMIVIANAIVNSEYMTDGQIETMVKQLADGLRG